MARQDFKLVRYECGLTKSFHDTWIQYVISEITLAVTIAALLPHGCEKSAEFLIRTEPNVEPAREMPVAGRWEVLVVGGGPAGVGAALAAARTGARTTLVEHYGFLGGMWTAGLLNPILDHHEKGGMVAEIIDRLRAAGKLVEGPRANFDNEYLKYLLDRHDGRGWCRDASVSLRCGDDV